MSLRENIENQDKKNFALLSLERGKQTEFRFGRWEECARKYCLVDYTVL